MMAVLAVVMAIAVDPAVLTLLVGTVVPLITNIVTKSSAPSNFKALVMLILSVVAGVAATALQNDGKFVFEASVIGVFMALTAAHVSYQAVWKRTGVTDALSSSPLGEFGLDPGAK